MPWQDDCMQVLPAGIGWKMDQVLTAVGVTSANDACSVRLAELTKASGERTAKCMHAACRREVQIEA